MKKIFVESYGNRTACGICTTTYTNNKNLCVEMMCDEGPFATITVNTPIKLDSPYAAVKVYSENEFVPAMLRKYKLATPTGTYTYGHPIYKFDLERCAEYAYQPPKPKKLNKIESLRLALEDALWKAEHGIPSEDSGTCNFDTLYIKLPRMKHAEVERVCKELGMHAWYEGQSFWNIGKLFGQGWRNTKAQEIMCEHLKGEGYTVYVHYRMD